MSKKQPVMSHDPLADVSATDVSEPTAIASADSDEASSDAGLADSGVGSSVALPSSLTISDVGELYADLLQRLSSGESLHLEGGDIEVVDGAGLQCLAAFFKDAAEKQIAVEWTSTSDALLQGAEQIGLGAALNLQGTQQGEP